MLVFMFDKLSENVDINKNMSNAIIIPLSYDNISYPSYSSP